MSLLFQKHKKRLDYITKGIIFNIESTKDDFFF